MNEGSSVQGAVADEVNRRLEKATNELASKYGVKASPEDADGAKSIREYDGTGPTGQAYKDKHEKDRERQTKSKLQSESGTKESNSVQKKVTDENNNEEEEDEDRDLRNLREIRLNQMRQAVKSRQENISKGHGQVTEISQDEFLAQVTSSQRVICHFYHDDFSRCAIMNHHLDKLAHRHIESKFLKINAGKAPFFVDKLKIVTIPTLVLFVDGIAVDKVLGFDGIADMLPADKVDEFPTMFLATLLARKRIIDSEAIKDDDEEQRDVMARLRMMQMSGFDDDELDLDD